MAQGGVEFSTCNLRREILCYFNVEIPVLWNVVICSQEDNYKFFRGICCFCHGDALLSIIPPIFVEPAWSGEYTRSPEIQYCHLATVLCWIFVLYSYHCLWHAEHD